MGSRSSVTPKQRQDISGKIKCLESQGAIAGKAWSSWRESHAGEGAGIRPNTQQSWFELSVPPLTVSPQPNPSILYFEKWYSATWAPKNCCFRTAVLEKTLESPLESQEIKLVNPKGNQPWILIGRTDAEALVLRPPDAKSRLIGKDPDAGKDGGQKKKKREAEDEMVG